ncbi:MAG: AMP-binding protein [Clostridia bacterium]|nr:AMP-binding protein [Clostridia bacterium]
MYKNYKKNYAYNEVSSFDDFKQVLEDSIKICEGRPAFKYKKGQEIVSVSYEEFYNDTKALGSALAKLGSADKHVAVVGPNSYKWLTVFLTMLNAEGVFVPIDKELPFEEIMRLVNDSDAEMFFFAEFYAENVEKNKENMPKVKKFVNLDAKEDNESGTLSYDKLMEEGKALIESGYTGYTDMKPMYEELKMLVYTSGTTGQPKGVMLSLKNIVNCVYHGLRVSTVYDVCLSVLPYHHTYESVCGILVSLKKAATICINENLRTVAANLKLYKPKYIMLVPLFLESFYKKIWANAEDTGKAGTLKKMIAVSNALLKTGVDMRPVFFKKIREVFGGDLVKIVCGGAPLRQELGEFFESVGVYVCNGYGITECSPLIAANRDYYYNFASVGNQLPCLELKIYEPNADGEGEICVRGNTVMLGYYKRPDLTKEVIEENGWFHTGDFGKIGEDGRVYITGRKKNMIVLKNGKNIYPEEVEDSLQSNKEIEEIIVSAIKGEDGEEIRLSAEIYPSPDMIEKMSDDELYDAIKKVVEASNDKLPLYKRITKVVIRKTPFEKTTSGKIKRKY